MFKRKMISSVAAILSIMVILAGCGTPAIDTFIDHVEKASAAETEIPALFEQLKKLEEKDQAQYANILEQGQNSNESVLSLIDSSTKALDERKQAMDKAKQQLDEAMKQLGDMTGTVKDIKDDALKQQAQDVLGAYNGRYEAFQQLYKSYDEWVKAEQAVYEQLKSSDTKLKDIQEVIAARNKAFKQAEQFKEQFNGYTEQFNMKKQALYTAAGVQQKG
ncbi:YkyA family protein [Paenibacillus sp. 1001270B_150601_E10]|uniref:YkyA family protein n=1 Tax=Paenibacillus sp. 1001270B_150601_E10 TaxID=2787079 RepID=UPI00189CD39C|nr:YkyA family protein [Paenibacillus sp. 1001270B_150601_E10]